MVFNIGLLQRAVARNVKLLQEAWKEAQRRIAIGEAALEPIPVPVRQPIPKAARIRQARSGWSVAQTFRRGFSTIRSTPVKGIKFDRSTYPTSRTGNAINASSGRAPFASTLRPNLTGGTLGRTAGGYSLGGGRVGGARYFSHGPAAPQQVVQNVSQAIRAFTLAGQKAQYAGPGQNGEKRFRAVSTLQDETSRKMQKLPRATPGSFVDFQVNPTITALTPLASVAGFSAATADECQTVGLKSDGLLDILSTDFSRALQELTAVLSDLKRLSALGDLPISYNPTGRGLATLRVHFPGCDAETVENLCQELSVSRGVVTQDPAFDAFAGTEIALLFPFAPSVASSTRSMSFEDALSEDDEPNLFSPVPSDMRRRQKTRDDGFSTLSEQSFSAIDASGEVESDPWSAWSPEEPSPRSVRSASTMVTESHAPSEDPLEYQDFEGIYRFIVECDNARRS